MCFDCERCRFIFLLGFCQGEVKLACFCSVHISSGGGSASVAHTMSRRWWCDNCLCTPPAAVVFSRPWSSKGVIISFLESLILASFGHCSKSSRVCPRGFSFKKIFLIEILFHFFLRVWVFCLHVYLCIAHLFGVFGYQKRMLSSLELGLQMAVSFYPTPF